MSGDSGWLACVLASGLLAGVVAGGASAQDRYYVLRDGSKVPLTKSTTELAVMFRPGAKMGEASRRLEAAGYGRVADFEGAPGARIKMLRLSTVGDVLPADVGNDEAVDDVRPVYRFAGVDAPVVSTGTIVLQLHSQLSDAERERMWDEYRIVQVEPMEGLAAVYVVTPVAGTNEVLLAERLAGDDRTLWANPNFRRAIKRTQVAGSDPLFVWQWHLQNTGQTGGEADADIDAPEAWSIADGSGVLFGMFDDACDVDHEDLRDNYIGRGQDITLPIFDEDYNNPRPKEDGENHGTAVMGLAVAAGNSVGVKGVAHRARFTATRGLQAFVPDAIVAGVYTFAMQQNVDVHINSWGFGGQFAVPPVLETALETAFENGRDPDGEGGEDPRGMVIVFAAGNANEENIPGSLEDLPTVIAVGASTPDDTRAAFSNFGRSLNFVAPGGDNINLGITTTDVEDEAEGEEAVTQGYNVGGFNADFQEVPDIDPEGSYTGFFGGTSAACPIAAGVAGLILSVNPEFTALDVRLIMEHTSDRVHPEEALYGGVTGRSLKYGYGRINADRAVQAAAGSPADENGRPITWPEIPADLRTEGDTLRWTAGAGTDEFLVVESADFFEFIPQDGACYNTLQTGCAAAEETPLPDGVEFLLPMVRCPGGCEPGNEQSTAFESPLVGTKAFAVYGRNSMGRYSFGVASETTAVQPPAVTIAASPLEGPSPLRVFFNGNASSEFPIDQTATAWDFDYDPDEGFTVDAAEASVSHKYEADPGEIRVFTAKLVMQDTLGNEGSAVIRIRVFGPAENIGGSIGVDVDIRMLVGVPGTTGSDVAEGTSPFQVELRIESDTPGTIHSVNWDLGDGSPPAAGMAVPHTYINESGDTFVLPVTARVTTVTPTGGTVSTTVTRLITVRPGTPPPDVGDPDLPGTNTIGNGGSSIPCGSVGILPLMFSVTGLVWLRRRRY